MVKLPILTLNSGSVDRRQQGSFDSESWFDYWATRRQDTTQILLLIGKISQLCGMLAQKYGKMKMQWTAKKRRFFEATSRAKERPNSECHINKKEGVVRPDARGNEKEGAARKMSWTAKREVSYPKIESISWIIYLYFLSSTC